MSFDMPAMQNIPIETDLSRAIKEALRTHDVALLETDYGLIELRILRRFHEDAAIVSISDPRTVNFEALYGAISTAYVTIPTRRNARRRGLVPDFVMERNFQYWRQRGWRARSRRKDRSRSTSTRRGG